MLTYNERDEPELPVGRVARDCRALGLRGLSRGLASRLDRISDSGWKSLWRRWVLLGELELVHGAREGESERGRMWGGGGKQPQPTKRPQAPLRAVHRAAARTTREQRTSACCKTAPQDLVVGAKDQVTISRSPMA